MQIKAFIHLIILAGKLPTLALKEGKKEWRRTKDLQREHIRKRTFSCCAL